jgi:hypothetical protein
VEVEYAAQIRRAAGGLRAFPLDVFSDDGLGPELGPGRGDAVAAAELAAGAIMIGVDTLVDRLFEDLLLLTASGASSVAVYDGDDSLLALEYLPPLHRHQYSQLFVQKFLVATVTVTDRLTRDEWTPAVTVAEELGLHLLAEQALIVLESADVQDLAYTDWEGAFREVVFEDLDFEVLYEPSLDGIENDAKTGRALGIAPLGFAAWFRPFNSERRTHPYATDA